MTTRRARSAAVAAVTACALAACSAPGSGGADGGESADAVVIGVPTEPDTLNPLLGYRQDGNSKSFGGRLPRDAVVIGVSTEPDTLNPLLGYGKDGNSKIFDGLLARDAEMNLKPALAKALPEISEDGRTYTFTLRDDVKFTDGEPLTSEDVVFT